MTLPQTLSDNWGERKNSLNSIRKLWPCYQNQRHYKKIKLQHLHRYRCKKPSQNTSKWKPAMCKKGIITSWGLFQECKFDLRVKTSFKNY